MKTTEKPIHWWSDFKKLIGVRGIIQIGDFTVVMGHERENKLPYICVLGREPKRTHIHIYSQGDIGDIFVERDKTLLRKILMLAQ
jgi:uncharacterized protein with NRDE domain